MFDLVFDRPETPTDGLAVQGAYAPETEIEVPTMAHTPRPYPTIPFLLTLAAVATVLTPLPVRAQEQTTTDALTTEAFLRPPEEIAQAVLAPRYLNVSLGNPSPDGRFFVQEQGDGPPSMASSSRCRSPLRSRTPRTSLGLPSFARSGRSLSALAWSQPT